MWYKMKQKELDASTVWKKYCVPLSIRDMRGYKYKKEQFQQHTAGSPL